MSYINPQNLQQYLILHALQKIMKHCKTWQSTCPKHSHTDPCHPYCWALVESGEHKPKKPQIDCLKEGAHTLNPTAKHMAAKSEEKCAILWEEKVKVLNVPITVAQIHLKGRITGRKERDCENPFSVLDNSMRMHGESAPSLLGFQSQVHEQKPNNVQMVISPVSANQNRISCSAIKQDT